MTKPLPNLTSQSEANTGVNEEDVLTNQTQFAEEEPIMQGSRRGGRASAGGLAQNASAGEPDPKRDRLLALGVILVGAIGLMIVILGVATFVQPMLVQTTATPTPSPVQTETGSIMVKQLQTLKQQLEQADPGQFELSFPPIQSDIKIVDKK